MISKLLKKNKNGFTLMEMLIVVAIIAVLVAIAIPTFNASLKKARIATDEANIRAGYASTLAAVLTNNFDVEQTAGANAVYFLKADGNVVAATDAGAAPADADLYKCKASNDNAGTTVGGAKVGAWTKDQTVKYTYDYDNNTIAVAFN